jgi:hypothetical protein
VGGSYFLDLFVRSFLLDDNITRILIRQPPKPFGRETGIAALILKLLNILPSFVKTTYEQTNQNELNKHYSSTLIFL